MANNANNANNATPSCMCVVDTHQLRHVSTYRMAATETAADTSACLNTTPLGVGVACWSQHIHQDQDAVLRLGSDVQCWRQAWLFTHVIWMYVNMSFSFCPAGGTVDGAVLLQSMV